MRCLLSLCAVLWAVSCAMLCAASLAWAQGTTPKSTLEDYPAHATVGNVGVGAEFMVHSFSRGEQMFIAPDYLVVEVAMFPPKGQGVLVEPGKFSLRINGRKAVLFVQAPAAVASSLNHPEWEQRSRADAAIGIGGIGVGTGQPRQTGPFPGAPQSRLPQPPRAPDADNPAGIERERVKPEELLVETALPGGDHRGPVSGFLYFAFKGKIGSIKSLELLFESAVLKLR
jgi:hypothetical protein